MLTNHIADAPAAANRESLDCDKASLIQPRVVSATPATDGLRSEIASLTRWAADALAKMGCSRLLASRFLDRARIGLGGSHSVVTYPPLDILQPINPDKIMKGVSPVDNLNLYVHIPVCEHLCPFCHYNTLPKGIDATEPVIIQYLNALDQEASYWRSGLRGSTLQSLYVGGGSPIALHEKHLIKTLEMVEGFERSPQYSACIEVSPETIIAPSAKAKLRILRNAGITRVSIGVQTFDNDILLHCRQHDQSIALKAVDTIMREPVFVNIDMIQDLPGQTEESIVEDLLWIDSIRPHQVTWYVLRFHEGSSWFGQFRRGDLFLPDSFESSQRRLLIIKAMELMGYMPGPGGRFLSRPEYGDNFKCTRSGMEATLVGMGVSAYSRGWGYFFRNHHSVHRKSALGQYVDCMNSSGSAIVRGTRLDEAELAAGRIIWGIRSQVTLPEPTESTRSYLEFAAQQLCTLEEYGLVRRFDERTFGLTTLGVLFEDEVCTSLYSKAVRSRLKHQQVESPDRLVQVN